jgi:hypothetical protein
VRPQGAANAEGDVTPQRCLEMTLNAIGRDAWDEALAWSQAGILALLLADTPAPRAGGCRAPAYGEVPRSLHEIAASHRPIAVWAGLRPGEQDPRD